MTKSLLTLLLLATQLLSWSGPVLWICVCGSGQTCIVGDPKTCKCCDRYHSEGEPCCATEASDGDVNLACDRSRSGRDIPLIGSSSGCPHFQLSQHQGAMVTSAKFADDAVRFVAVIGGPASIGESAIRDSEAPVFWPLRVPKPVLAELAHVVLRC